MALISDMKMTKVSSEFQQLTRVAQYMVSRISIEMDEGRYDWADGLWMAGFIIGAARNEIAREVFGW